MRTCVRNNSTRQFQNWVELRKYPPKINIRSDKYAVRVTTTHASKRRFDLVMFAVF